MAICYLEVDDEVTSAIARIRAAKDREIVIVVPAGSRIATSRINFKLLAREAVERDLSAVAVSDEPQVRALAISAGLPAYDSITAAQQALAGFREQDARLAARLGDSATSGTRVLPSADVRAALQAHRATDTAVLSPDTASELGGATGSSPPLRRRRRRRGPPLSALIAIGLLAVLVVGVGYAAYVFLPTAQIRLRPAAVEIRPPVFTVTADPNVAVVDADAGIIPAELVSVPLHVAGVFDATGTLVRETRATGTVRFRSENTVDPVLIPEGTIVATGDGIDFETTRAATVPRADFATSTPGTVDVPIRAVRPGTRSNVVAGAVSEVPAALRALRVSVRNQEPTRGGQRVEESVVSQSDFDAALASLSGQIEPALAAALADPDTVPRGLVAFAGTATLGEQVPDPAAADLVDTAAETFALALDVTAQVVAVNESLLDEVGAARIRTQLTPGRVLVGDEVVATHDAGTVVGTSVVYNVTASAWSFVQPDTAQVIEQVRGRSLAEARARLAQLGEAEIVIWPEFVDRLPEQPARISVSVEQPAVAP